MKSFKAMMAEVAQPESEEEKKFKDQHTYEVKPHPVAMPHQHTGDIQKPKAKRKADQEGDANYDLAYESFQKALDKKMFSEGEMADRDALAKAGEVSKAGKKAVTLKKAPWDKTEELSPKQKKIDHNKNGKIDGHDLAMIRAKKNEETELDEAGPKIKGDFLKVQRAKDAEHNAAMGRTNTGRKKPERAMTSTQKSLASMNKEEAELDETTVSATKRPVNVTGPDGITRTVYKRSNVNVTDNNGQDKIKTNEALDEAFKAGIVKFKDGKQTILKKEDADLLNKMMKDLSSGSRKSMGKVAMTDQAGFDEILGFAREAL